MVSKKGITIIGLGSGDIESLTVEAWEFIKAQSTIYLRTKHHPLIDDLPKNLTLESFDQIYEDNDDFEKVYEIIIETILKLGAEADGVSYAVPGHPFVAEATAPEIVRRAKEQGIPVRVIHGISFIEASLAALGVDILPQTVIVDALEIAGKYHPIFSPNQPALITQIYSSAIANEIKLTLMAQYDDEHQVALIHAAGTSKEIVEEIPLHEIDKSVHIGLLSSLYLPPIQENSSLEEFQELVAHLRSPEGCPWDREQTHESLRRNLLEETYELLEAIDANDIQSMQEEFGDLLVQIVLHAQIANEAGEFKMSDIIHGIHTKLVDRHPHVFGDEKIEDAQGVIESWERIKADERRKKGKETSGVLDSVAVALPALTQAEAYGARAARSGFDWPDVSGVLDKISEEIIEINGAEAHDEIESEFGDLLFALVNYARWKEIDPEVALRGANIRFKDRFSYIEKSAREKQTKLSEMSLVEMEKLWEEGKSKLRK